MAHSSARFERVAEIFESALGHAEGTDREAYLSSVSAEEADLLLEVRRLLESDSVVRRRSTETARRLERLPRFGPYQARELIGTGGMGAVYRATREDGEVQQEVAVKMVASVLWSSAVDERFRRERQILAGLQHPNIARFLNTGATTEGVPYLVMEYVKGERVDVWCDRARLPIRERLELFLKICEAVIFAHQRLIVHRDLKPGNILVNASGNPVLLDFGIARTIDPTDVVTSASHTAGLLFTPLYASPEQLKGEAAGVSCDVYALGVLLFELLVGSRPFGRPESTPAELVEQVLSSEAKLTSASVQETNDAALVRGVDSARALRRQLQGDLDAIVAKALCKDVTSRYSSVEQLTGDIRRYLNGYPVHAASTGAAYQVRKFVRRHKTGAAAVAVVMLSILVGSAATLWQAHVAQQERAAAERRFNVARELAGYLVFDLQTGLEQVAGTTPLRAEIIDHSVAYLDRLAAEKSSDKALQTELGRGYLVLGDVLGAPYRPSLGRQAKARELYRKAIATLVPVASRNPNDRDANVYLTRSRAMLGRSLEFSGDSPAGHKLLEQAANESAVLIRKWPQDFTVRFTAGVLMYWRARSLATGSGFFVTAANAKPALEAARQSVEHDEIALRLKPEDLEIKRELANSLAFVGYIVATRDVSDATQYFRQALEVLDKIPEKERSSTIARQARASVLQALGRNLGALGQNSEAIQDMEEACQIRDGLAVADRSNVQAQLERESATNNLATIEDQAGKQRAALEHYLSALEQINTLIEGAPNNQNFLLLRADLEMKTANLCSKAGRQIEGERLATAAISFYKEAASRSDASHVELTLAAQALMEVEVRRLRDPKLALAFMNRASQKLADDSFIQEELAKAYWLNGDRTLALDAIRKALSLTGSASTPERNKLIQTLREYEAGSHPKGN